MTAARSARAAALALALAGGVGCGGGQTHGDPFNASWVNDQGAGISAFQKRFSSTAVKPGTPVAIGVTGQKTIVGVPLDGGKPWTYEHALDSRPSLVGEVLIGLGGGSLFALDAATGQPLWTRPAGGKLRGAGDDGKTTVVSLVSATGAGTTLLAVDRGGAVVRQLEDDVPIGVPAVVGRYAFLPWRGQYVTVFDLTEGEEAARALLRVQTSHAFVEGGTLFFGEMGLVRFDDRIGDAHRGAASHIQLPARELPGKPAWLRSGLEPGELVSTALDNVRLYARPAPAGEATVEGGRFAATYYQIALGFDAASGALGWAYTHDADFIGGDAYQGGFALCDASGDVTLLDGQTGAVAGRASLGRPVDVCLVNAGGLEKGAAGGAPALPEQLAAAVRMPEAKHVMVQKFLLREMSALTDPSVTKALIDLASDPKTPPMLDADARRALAARRNGADHMMAALERHYDFLAGVLRPPPVGPIAEALGAMKESRAAPLLAKHLNDPANTLDDVERAAAALSQLGGAAERPALEVFFAHYRCAAEEEPIANAVVSVATALVRLGAEREVAAALADPLTTAELKPRLESLVKAAEPAAAPKGSGPAQPAAK